MKQLKFLTILKSRITIYAAAAVALFFTILILVNFFNPTNCLKRAVYAGNLQSVQRAIERGADVNISFERGHHVIVDALHNRRHSIVAVLTKAGANLDVPMNPKSGKIMRTEVFKNHKYYRESLMTMMQHMHLNRPSAEGLLPLYYALAQHDFAFADTLRYYGADVNTQDSLGRTLLHKVHGDAQVEYLLKTGATIDAQDNRGCTPLHVCLSTSSIERLIAAGADFSILNNCGTPPAHYALAHGNYQGYNTLVKHGADIGVVDSLGNTILMYAYVQSNIDLLESVEKDYCSLHPTECKKAKQKVINAAAGSAFSVLLSTSQKVKRIKMKNLHLGTRMRDLEIRKRNKRRGRRGRGKRGILKKINPLLRAVGTIWSIGEAWSAASAIGKIHHEQYILDQQFEAIMKKRTAAQEELRQQFLNC